MPQPHESSLPNSNASPAPSIVWKRLLPVTITGLLTAVSTGMIVHQLVAIAIAANPSGLTEALLLYGVVLMLIYCNWIYHLANYGHCRRLTRDAACPRETIEGVYDQTVIRSELLVLVPSYKEEAEGIRRTLISAALAEYPRRRVVLLIDDPPIPASAADAARLAAARRLTVELQALFAAPAEWSARALAEFEDRACRDACDTAKECANIADLYSRAAEWLEALAAGSPAAAADHTERLFVDKILLEPARAHRRHALELRREILSDHAARHEYRRLAGLFAVGFSSFERKRYVNLSHIPNKAMNLNSYLALIGRSWHEVECRDGLYLEQGAAAGAMLTVPPVDYIATIDADSLITADYATRLIAVMEMPGNERIGVAQSPYTAIPDASTALERAAAASTDAQFFNHLGLGHFGVSAWVGASALMRRAILDDLARRIEERGHPVTVFIDHEILIEDAAATIDLLAKGWRVHHAAERLSYSATPADFGALLIQRRRWANGGLLILPSLLRHLLRRPAAVAAWREGVLRVPQLLSAALNGIGLPVLLFYRFDDSLVPLWLPLAAVPYYALYGCDLMLAGYRWSDLPRVYALNLLLIPVNLAGTLASLRQAFTGRSPPFRRTPKIAGRTAVPAAYLVGILAAWFYGIGCGIKDGVAGNQRHMLFELLFAVFAGYGVTRFIGWRAVRQDLAETARAWRIALETRYVSRRMAAMPADGE